MTKALKAALREFWRVLKHEWRTRDIPDPLA